MYLVKQDLDTEKQQNMFLSLSSKMAHFIKSTHMRVF